MRFGLGFVFLKPMRGRTGLRTLVLTIVTFAALAGAISCRSSESSEPALKAPRSLSEKVPPDIQAAIRSASRIEAFLVNYYGPGEQAEGLDEGHHATSAPVGLNKEQFRELKRLVLDRQSYVAEGYKCEFNPDVAYRFLGKADTVFAVIGHGCDELWFFKDRRRVGGGFVPRAALQFEELSHSIFPEDSVVSLRWRQGRENASVGR